MPITIETPAVERGAHAIAVSFFDENGDPATPNSGLTWTLTDTHGAVVNSRSAVAIAVASEVTVVLSGADLALLSTYYGNVRLLTFDGTYDSATLGNNLPLREQVRFSIVDV